MKERSFHATTSMMSAVDSTPILVSTRILVPTPELLLDKNSIDRASTIHSGWAERSANSFQTASTPAAMSTETVIRAIPEA